MPKTTSEIVVGANGTVRVASTATARPADISVAYAAGWKDLGYTDENGITLKDAKTIIDIPVWQLFYPGRKIVGSRAFTASQVLRQFSGDQVELAFGGATVVEDSAGKFSIHPPAAETLSIVQYSVEWLDGSHKYRWFLPACIVEDDVEFKVARTSATDLPITLGVVGSDGAEPWFGQTDDPSFINAT